MSGQIKIPPIGGVLCLRNKERSGSFFILPVSVHITGQSQPVALQRLGTQIQMSGV